MMFRAGLYALATLSLVACTAEGPPATAAAEEEVVSPPLPSDLNLVLNATATVTIGAFTTVNGDVGSSGLSGSVLFDVGSSQGFGGFNVVANTVTVNTQASVGHVFGNDITINGFASQQSLGLDPAAMPQVPAVTAATTGTTNVSTNENQAKQLCPGQYGAIALGVNSTLSLNGGVYHVTRLTLADGARLEPSEPLVILVSGGMTTGIGSVIRPSAQALNPMSAASIRIEVGGAVTLGGSNQIRAHLLTGSRFVTGTNFNLAGAVWARAISIGTNSQLGSDGVFSGVCNAGTCEGGTTSGTFSYSAVDTNSATQNTFNFDIAMAAGQTLSIGTCGLAGASGFGDTLLRLFDPSNIQVAVNDDACGVLSFFTFTAATTGMYQVRAGCFASNSCGGTVAFTLSGP